MTNKKLILIFTVVFFIFVLLAVFLTFLKPDENVAIISVNGKEYQTISLEEDRTFSVNTEYGENQVEVNDGNIRILSADCPDKLCIRHGKLHSKYDSIVCLPNKLVIEYKTDNFNSGCTVIKLKI